MVEHLSNNLQSIGTGVFPGCMLVTIASLQRARAVQNNRMTTCREEGQRFNTIRIQSEHTADIKLYAATAPVSSPESLILCAFNYPWGAKRCSHHSVQVLEHKRRYTEFLHPHISDIKKERPVNRLLHPWPHQLFLSLSARAVNLLTGVHVSWGISPGPAGLTFLTQACNTVQGDTVELSCTLGSQLISPHGNNNINPSWYCYCYKHLS